MNAEVVLRFIYLKDSPHWELRAAFYICLYIYSFSDDFPLQIFIRY